MKKFFLNFICIIAFILCFAGKVLAANIDITSVVYDNSASFLTINTKASDDITFQTVPKLIIDQEGHKAYFDIDSAMLQTSAQDLVITSSDIKEILVKQISESPDIVRVTISYKESYNPKNIQLKVLGNTLFVRFATAQIQNYYFQQVYTDAVSTIGKFYTPIGMQVPLQIARDDIVSQINAAFQLGATTEDKNYVLTKKELLLASKYYIDNFDVKNGIVQVNGIGALTLTKPFTLSNPTRAVYDIPNTIVNPAIRNRELYISQTETVKVGQFEGTTARVVITSKYADKYMPVVSPDGQNLEFINNVTGQKSLFSHSNATFNSVSDDIIDASTHCVKLIFSKPVIYGIDRLSDKIEFYLFNVDKVNDIDLKSGLLFEGAEMTSLPGKGLKLSIPLYQGDIADIHTGNDGKTIRLKIKSKVVELPQKKIDPPTITVPPVVITAKKPGEKVVVIDPGHGGSDCGAIRNGINEKNITLDVSKRVAEILTSKGVDVYMTRDTDATVSLQERVDISENVNPDVFVSIHVNSSNSESPNGLETHYYKDNSLTLAKTVHASMLNHIKAKDRGLFKSKFYVINHTTAPAVLVEIGFLSNTAERGQLVTESRKQATAKAIAEGIYEYLK